MEFHATVAEHEYVFTPQKQRPHYRHDKCGAKTAKGTMCTRSKLVDKPFCYQHVTVLDVEPVDDGQRFKTSCEAYVMAHGYVTPRKLVFCLRCSVLLGEEELYLNHCAKCIEQINTIDV
jgi:hypothetical protein